MSSFLMKLSVDDLDDKLKRIGHSERQGLMVQVVRLYGLTLLRQAQEIQL
jgi:hypothetical protein